MWAICKYKKKNLYLLINSLKDKLGSDLKFYIPKIRYEKNNKGKIKIIEENILESYCMLYHPKFNDEKIVNYLKYTKGAEYFLNGFRQSQEQIKNFLEYCKSNENSDGFITQSFFEKIINKKAKFLNGPFANTIFTIIGNYKDKLKILTRGFTITINKKSGYLYRSL
tara:strand:+ start:2534 stop:3034 length:501 start_codon:yes stop_codon:yes gene_type:complete